MSTGTPMLTPTFDSSEITRVFNTALLGTRPSLHTPPALPNEGLSSALVKLVASPAYQAILKAILDYSESAGLSPAAAAEDVIRTFRNADYLWADYAYREGLERIKSGE